VRTYQQIQRHLRIVGIDELKVAIDECEGAVRWWDAVMLWCAATTLTPTKAGEELKRTMAAISNLPDETDKMGSLDSKVSSLLMVVQEGACECVYIFTYLLVSIVCRAHLSVSYLTTGGYVFGSPEHEQMFHKIARVAGCKIEVQCKGGVRADSMSSLIVAAGKRCCSLGVGFENMRRSWVMK